MSVNPSLLTPGTLLYVQISNIIDTSIKHPISGQSTPMLKSCMDIMLGIIDAAFSYWKAFIHLLTP